MAEHRLRTHGEGTDPTNRTHEGSSYTVGSIEKSTQVADCPFCHSSLVSSGSDFDRVLAQTPHFRLLPALGMLLPGYLLITPIAHTSAMAHLDVQLLNALSRWVDEVVAALTPEFGDYLVFEHGSCPGTTTSACVEHAHFHLIPLAEVGDNLLSDSVIWQEQPAMSSLRSLVDHSYMYLRLGPRHYTSIDPEVGSQWIRRKVAERLGQENWDWAIDTGEPALRETLTRLPVIPAWRVTIPDLEAAPT